MLIYWYIDFVKRGENHLIQIKKSTNHGLQEHIAPDFDFDKKQTALLTIVARRGAIRPSGEEI